MKASEFKIVAVAALLLYPVIAQGHPGRVDKNGGHVNTQTGEYHKHQHKEPVKSCGTVTHVLDGDTFDIDLGNNIITRVRLQRTNAPELDTEEGQAAKAELAKRIEGKKICIEHTNTHDKYGRLLATLAKREDGSNH